MKPANEREEIILREALNKARGPERECFLDGACLGDQSLRDRLEALLLADDSAGVTQPEAALTENAPVLFPPVEAPGAVIGRYKILEKIGEGGFGVVYVAEQREPVKRRVALKVIKLGMDTRQVVARFEAERQALALMDHPNIAKVLDGGATDTGRPFFVMELVRGTKITDYCDEHQLSTKERLELFMIVCQAIQHAHQKGIIHRDIKPSNILVSLNDGVPVAKVIDFGIAKATHGTLTDKTLFTMMEQFIGTPSYMSPEQAEMRGEDIDTRSDIYSLGVVLYELLTGRTPLDSKALLQRGIEELILTLREVEPPRPSTRLSTLAPSDLQVAARFRRCGVPKLITSLRGDLDWIVMKCLEKDRTRRYETANGVAMDIERHLKNEPVVARPPTVGYRLQKSFRRNRLVFTAAGAIGMALLLGAVVSTWQAVRAVRAGRSEAEAHLRADRAARVAESERERAATGEQKAKASELAARQNLYAADMTLAQQDLEAGNLRHARQLVDKYVPRPGEADLRGWEWRYLWGQCRSDELVTLGQHDIFVRTLAFSPAGRLLATISSDQVVKVWDYESRREVAALQHPTERDEDYLPLAFSADGKVLAVGLGNVIRFYGTSGFREVNPVLHFSNQVMSVAFSKEGKTMAVVEKDRLRLLDVASRQELANRAVPGAKRVAFSPTRSIVALSGDRQVALLDSQTLTPLQSLPGRSAFFSWQTLSFSPDGKWLAAAIGDNHRSVLVWDLETFQVRANLTHSNTSWIGPVAFSPDGKALATTGADETIRIWSTATWSDPTILRGHVHEVWALGYSPDGRYLASGGKDGTVKLWDARPPPKQQSFRVLPAGSRTALSPSGDILLVTGTNQTYRLWETGSFKESPPYPLFLPDADIWAVSTGGVRVALGNKAGVLVVGEPVSGRVIRPSAAQAGPFESLVFSSDGRFLAGAGADGATTVWDAASGTQRARWEHDPGEWPWLNVAFSPDGRVLARAWSSSFAGLLETMDVTTGQPQAHLPLRQRAISALAMTPDNRGAITSSQDGNVMIWDLAGGRKRAELSGELMSYSSLALSADGRRLAAYGAQGTVTLWDAALTQPLQVAMFPQVAGWHGSLEMAFSLDGNTLVAADSYTLWVWQAPSLAAIEAAEIRAEAKAH